MEQLARCRAAQQSRFHALAMEVGMTLDSVLFCQVSASTGHLSFTSARVHEPKRAPQIAQRFGADTRCTEDFNERLECTALCFGKTSDGEVFRRTINQTDG